MFYLIDPDNTFNYICVTILTEMTLSGDFVTKIRTFPRPNEADKGVYNYFFDGEKYGVEEPAGGEGRRYAGPFTLRAQSVLIGNSLTTLFGFESAVPSGGEVAYLNNPAFTGLNIGTENPYLAVVYHKDHLGSTRAITKVDGTILEQNDYYPFGLRTTMGENYSTLSESLAAIAQNANNTTANTIVPEYLYNGKEKQDFIKNTSAVINAGGSADYTSNYIDYGARFYNPTTIRWNTQDPMTEKYQRFSPYNYCVNDPISFEDLNGNDPIYARNFWGIIRKIGDDGKNNNCSHFVINRSIKKEVKQATKLGENYQGDLFNNNDVLHIPSGDLLNDIEQSYTKTKESKKENGGHANIEDSHVTFWDEGPEPYIVENEDGTKTVKATMSAFKINGENQTPKDASNLSFWYHIHPDVSLAGVRLGDSTPSKADKEEQKKLNSKKYSGVSFVVGVRTNDVTFFNSSSPIETIRWSTFLKMGRGEDL